MFSNVLNYELIFKVFFSFSYISHLSNGIDLVLVLVYYRSFYVYWYNEILFVLCSWIILNMYNQAQHKYNMYCKKQTIWTQNLVLQQCSVAEKVH